MFNSLQSMVNELQHQQERLLDTAANISHELGVNQDHVKVIIQLLTFFLIACFLEGTLFWCG